MSAYYKSIANYPKNLLVNTVCDRCEGTGLKARPSKWGTPCYICAGRAFIERVRFIYRQNSPARPTRPPQNGWVYTVCETCSGKGRLGRSADTTRTCDSCEGKGFRERKVFTQKVKVPKMVTVMTVHGGIPYEEFLKPDWKSRP